MVFELNSFLEREGQNVQRYDSVGKISKYRLCYGVLVKEMEREVVDLEEKVFVKFIQYYR